MKKVKVKYLYVYEVEDSWNMQSVLIERINRITKFESYVEYCRKRRLRALFEHVKI